MADFRQDTGYAKVIITALKEYAIILADNGSAWYITGERTLTGRMMTSASSSITGKISKLY